MPLTLGHSHGPIPALPGDPGGQCTNSVEDKPHQALPSSSAAAPKAGGREQQQGQGWLSPEGIASALGGAQSTVSQGPSVSGAPSTLVSFV